jgi:uncharacterized protein YneF (UPF0154 family)
MENKKEIDLISLIVWILNFIKRYLLIIGIFLLLGILGGLADYFLGRNFYNTKFIASSPVINNQIVYELIEPIKFYINHEMYDSVAAKLSVSKEVAEDIRKIEIDTTMSQAVVVDMQLYAKDNTELIKEGLINYINTIPYVKSTVEGKRSELERYLKDLNKEIEELNKLQSAVLQSIEGSKANNLTIDGMFNEMMLLYDRKLLLQAEYNSVQSFKSINSNQIFDTENSIFKSLVIFTFIGLFIGLLISTILEIRKKVKLQQVQK